MFDPKGAFGGCGRDKIKQTREKKPEISDHSLAIYLLLKIWEQPLNPNQID